MGDSNKVQCPMKTFDDGEKSAVKVNKIFYKIMYLLRLYSEFILTAQTHNHKNFAETLFIYCSKPVNYSLCHLCIKRIINELFIKRTRMMIEICLFLMHLFHHGFLPNITAQYKKHNQFPFIKTETRKHQNNI